MYTLPSKLKLFAIIFMVVGAIGIVSGFLTAPSTTAEVKEMMASHGDGHGSDHSTAEESHSTNETHVAEEAHGNEHAQIADAHDSEEAHLEHTLHQMQNRPWSALYSACLFFLFIALGTLAFYGIQYAAQAGWSPVLYRVMEGITAYLPVASVILFVLLLLSAFHINHIFHWMDPELVDPESSHYDKLIAGKSGWLNVPFFLIRAAIFLAGWNLYRYFSRRNSIRQDDADDNRWFKKNKSG